jgi:hypothetical protein
MIIKNNMKEIVEFNLVMENSKMKEDLGIEHLQFARCSFNIFDISYYRESLDTDGEKEPYTVIILESGLSLCLDVTYGEFDYIYKNKVLPKPKKIKKTTNEQ